MSENILKALAFCALGTLFILGCDTGQPAPAPQAVQPAPLPQPIQPAPQPVAAPVAPPPTPLMPVVDAEPEKPADDGARPRGKGKVDGIDKPLPGKATEGDELIGNYSCKLDAKGLPLGPFKLPEYGCRIFRADDGKLRLGPTSRSIASLRGEVQSPTQAGFFVVGGYKFPGNRLDVKARMKLKPGGKVVYSGKGRGTLNKDKSNKINYTLTMTRK